MFPVTENISKSNVVNRQKGKMNMNKKFKKAIASLIAVSSLATCMIGVAANAANNNFYFSLGDRGAGQWSSGNPKDDDEQTAYIHTLNGSVSSYAPAYFTLYSYNSGGGTPSSTYQVSNTQLITGASGYNSSYQIPYTVWRGQGQYTYIYAHSGYSGSSANGYWYS